jgi:hypothetical protein
MDATLYTGTGASLAITNAGAFKPDFVWVKGRSGATSHALYDSVRGTTIDLVSDSTAAETTQTTGLTAFGTGGFTVGALAKMNTSAATYVGWQWQAGQGTTSSNTSGSITSTVSVNATAGFSIVTYTGNGSNGTIGHGLNAIPKMIIAKARNTTSNWFVWSVGPDITTSKTGFSLNNTSAAGFTFNASGQITSTVFNTAYINDSSATVPIVNTTTYVAYCWAEIAGFSKFGSYTGNGSADGPFVFTNLKPRFIMIKRTDTTSNWTILDTAREGYNVDNDPLYPNLSDAEGTTDLADILSNGFKLRSTDASVNANAGTYIYACFSSNPFKNSTAV